MHLPTSFIQNMQARLGSAYDCFKVALATDPPISVRLHPQKSTAPPYPPSAMVPWCPQGIYLSERPIFTLDPLFHAGAYYVQEASSMFLCEVLRQLLPSRPNLKVLDMCAAPGGKSTLLASVLPKTAFLLCNEVIKSRVGALQENLTKWGTPNVAVSNHDSTDFVDLDAFFDVVLVDAPCSGEGLFRKDPKAVAEWSPENVQLCAARQRRIVDAAARLVCGGGLLLYSTCTYNAAENEDMGAYLMEQYGLEEQKLTLSEAWHIEARSVGYQFYPHRVRGEGFYIACFRKKESEASFLERSRARHTHFSMKKLPKKQLSLVVPYIREPEHFAFFIKKNNHIIALPKRHIGTCVRLDQVLCRKGFGLDIGQLKRNQLVPSHALALSTALAPTLPAVALTKEQALRYLKKETFDLPDAPQGWVLAQYEGRNLGWIKVLKNRFNNYLPKTWRIRMALR